MKTARRWFSVAALLFFVTGSIAAALAAVAWHALAAHGDEWSHHLRLTLGGRVIEQDLSMAALLRAATHPLAAALIDGRSVDTSQGRWRLTVLSDRSLAARCAPCRFALPALGTQPLVVERAVVVLHNEGADRYRGTLELGAEPAIRLEGGGQFNRRGQFAIEARLPPTPMADAVRVLGSDLPERDTVQVKGTLALSMSAATQRGPWHIKPTVEGFEVFGLDTERFIDMQHPAVCRIDARASAPAIGGWLPRAVVAAEDARFHEHPGYDLQALSDAVQHNQRSGAAIAGASTLTQQLAKLLVAGDERSASRKLRELLYAVEMERTLGKARILQLYLALAPWGDGVCGAARAVRVHLGQQDPSAVGPVAAAWLASLLPAPDLYLKADFVAQEVDHARVARVLATMRPMTPLRREKAKVMLLFWSPPALARLRESAAHASMPDAGGVFAEAVLPIDETPSVAPPP